MGIQYKRCDAQRRSQVIPDSSHRHTNKSDYIAQLTKMGIQYKRCDAQRRSQVIPDSCHRHTNESDYNLLHS